MRPTSIALMRDALGRAFRKSIARRIILAASAMISITASSMAQSTDDCIELARRCCASLTITIPDSMAYRVSYDVGERRRSDTSGGQERRMNVECYATRDFIWSKGDSADILRAKDGTFLIDKRQHLIYRTDGRLSDGEIEARMRMTSIIRDTLFNLVSRTECRDSGLEAPERRVVLYLKPLGGEAGHISSVTVTINLKDSTLRSLTVSYLGARDGVVQRDIRFNEPPHLAAYRRDQDFPMVLEGANGKPAHPYGDFRVVDLRNRGRN